MLELSAGKYRVEITNDPFHTVGSADNCHSYDHEYYLDDARSEYAVTSRHAVKISDKTETVATCILLAGGGASGIHQHSAIIHDHSCIIAVGPFITSLKIPSLELLWSTKTDTATCFGVYRADNHHCLISHGELEIARVSYDGQLAWQTGGADIFTNGITIHDNWVHVVDFNDMEYMIDIETGREIAAT